MLQTRLIPPANNAHAYPLLIKRLLLSGSRYEKTREIVYRDKLRYSYATFNERVARLANVLSQAGVKAGDTVAVMDWDSHRYLECMFAIPMLGAVLHTINIRLSPDQILYTMNHAEDRFVLVNSEFVPLYNGIAGQLTTVEKTLLLTDGEDKNADLPNLVGEYESLLAAASPHYDFADFDENSVATTFYTTGTTGLPKGVYFSHRQLVMHTMGAATGLGTAPVQGRLHRDDVYMPITPMFHVHAWGLPYVATMLGLKQVYPGRYQPEVLLRLKARERVTFSHCVPTILHMLLNHALARETDLSGWKVMIGGSALPQAMAVAALEKGIDVFTGYGMSETCPILSVAHLPTAKLQAPLAEQAALRARTGLPLPLVDLRIVDPEMRPQPHDGQAVGELVVRSPWLTQGYLKDPAAAEELWGGGYLHTADIGNIDANGSIQITDRIKDVIKTGGEWTSSLQLEDIIGQHPAVHEVAVIGVKDEKWGERPLALVVLKPEMEGQVTEHAIRNHAAHLAETLGVSRYGVLMQVSFVKTLARTSIGKINKRFMRENLEAAKAAQP